MGNIELKEMRRRRKMAEMFAKQQWGYKTPLNDFEVEDIENTFAFQLWELKRTWRALIKEIKKLFK